MCLYTSPVLFYPPPLALSLGVLQPHAIPASRMGVGACLWEGELFLAAYLGEWGEGLVLGHVEEWYGMAPWCPVYAGCSSL
jgi:hypothetical protein